MTTLWRPIPGFTGYFASLDGGIRGPWELAARKLKRRKDTGYIQTSVVGDDGRARVMFVHVLMMLAFRGPCPEGLEVLHENDRPWDNRLVNLSYGTHKQNAVNNWWKRRRSSIDNA